MSSGGGSGQTYTNQTSSAEPPGFIQPYLKGGIGDLTNLYNSNRAAPDFFPGSTVAAFSPNTQTALTMLANRGVNGSPVQTAAQGAVTDVASGKYLDPTTNPDYLKAIAASHQPYTDQFLNQIIPGITSQFARSGRSGGSGLQQAVTDQAVTNLNRNVANADATAGANYFTNAQNQRLGAAGMAPQMAGMDFQNIGAVGQAGEQQDAYNQAKINEDISRYNYNNNKQWNYINRYLASLNAGYPGGQTNSSGFTMGTQPSGGAGSIFGNAMSGLGMGLQVASMMGAFSDVRLKENIHRVGSTDDGQNLYFYNYKGDPTPHVGLMAQEVEQRNPDAVVEHPSGYKMVNYTKALGLF